MYERIRSPHGLKQCHVVLLPMSFLLDAITTSFQTQGILLLFVFPIKKNTAISINVVGLNLQTYKSRPNGAMGIYCNLHITIEEIYKFVFLHVEYLFFFP